MALNLNYDVPDEIKRQSRFRSARYAHNQLSLEAFGDSGEVIVEVELDGQSPAQKRQGLRDSVRRYNDNNGAAIRLKQLNNRLYLVNDQLLAAFERGESDG